MFAITIQLATETIAIPKKSSLRRWARQTLQRHIAAGGLTIRIVDKPEMTELNTTYRQKIGPTNVLSFPFLLPDDIKTDTPILGDIVICAEVVNEEASQQGKTPESHWAHMTVHGVYHLLGYDHENDHDAEVMEAHEIKTLQALGFANPYQIKEDKHND